MTIIHAKVTSKGQITLPIALRRRLRLGAGDKVWFEELADGGFVLRRKTRDIRELRGMLDYDGPPLSDDDIDRGIAQAVAGRLGWSR